MKEKTDALVVLKAIEKTAQPSMRKVSNLTISTHEDFVMAGQLLKEIKELAKEAKSRETGLVGPLQAVISDIRGLFKPFRDQVELLEADTKAKMLSFVEATKKKQSKLHQDFENGKIKKVSTLLAKTSELDIQSQYTQVRKVWTAICVDESKTPREYLQPNEAAIKEALKAGKKVAGWKWEQVETLAI